MKYVEKLRQITELKTLLIRKQWKDDVRYWMKGGGRRWHRVTGEIWENKRKTEKRTERKVT
jgi:hypothetical protein